MVQEGTDRVTEAEETALVQGLWNVELFKIEYYEGITKEDLPRRCCKAA